MSMGRKGISELVAAVMLIAFVVAAAGIISTFYSQFTREQVTKVETEGGETIDCSISHLIIQPDTVTTSNSDLLITVENTGKEDLSDIDVVFRNSTGDPFQTVDMNETVDTGNIETLTINGVTNSIDRITVTTVCPGLTDTVENVSGEFERITD